MQLITALSEECSNKKFKCFARMTSTLTWNKNVEDFNAKKTNPTVKNGGDGIVTCAHERMDVIMRRNLLQKLKQHVRAARHFKCGHNWVF